MLCKIIFNFSDFKSVKMSNSSDSKAVSESKKNVAKTENYKDGAWNLKYLQFVNAFISQTGMSYGEAAQKAGITRQTIYHWFSKDDAKLSSVINFIDKCGYTVRFSLKRESNMIGDALVTINSRDNFDTIGDKNLSFLDEALTRYGIQRKDAAAKIGLGYTALFYWFKHDDVFISYIYRIAEQNSLKLSIKIDPKQE